MSTLIPRTPQISTRFLTAICLAAWLCLLPGTAAGNLFTATVPVSFEHPPDLGFPVQTIAFASYEGECSDEFVNGLIEDFVGNGIDVVERDRLGDVLEAIDLSASGYIKENDAISLGELLGPSALIFVSTQRCAHDKSKSYKDTKTKEGSYRTYISTTKVYFKSSLRIVDLATGKIFSSKTVEETREDSNNSKGGYPEFPDEYALHDAMIHSAIGQVHRMLLPWSEVKEMRFFKDKKCNLQMAYQMVKARDYDNSVVQSSQNLEQCKSEPKVKPKLLARAHYNLGMSYFLKGEHDRAYEYLQQAQLVKPGPRITEAIGECQRSKELARNLRHYEELAARSTRDDLPPLADRLSAVAVNMGSAEPRLTSHSTAEAPPQNGVPQDDAGAGTGKRSVTERLKELKELFDAGILTAADFEAKKQEILKDL